MTELTSPFVQEKPSLSEIQRVIEAFDMMYKEGDIGIAVEAIGVPTQGKGTSQWSALIQERLVALSAPDQYGVREHLRNLKTEVVYAHVLFDRPLEPLLLTLTAATSISAPPNTHKTAKSINWTELIQAARVQSLLSPMYTNHSSMHLSREFTVASAARRLADRGFLVEQQGTQLNIEQETRGRLVAHLESLIRKLGGLNVLRHLFQMAAPSYDAMLERYLIVRDISSHHKRAPDFPWGYLIGLAAKHLIGSSSRQPSNELWQELVALATDFTAFHNVQDYTPPIFEQIPTDKLIDTLTRRALYDSIHTFPQLRSRDVIRMLRPLLTSIPRSKLYGPGWTTEDIFGVIEHLYRAIGDRRGPVTLDLRLIAKAIPGVTPRIAKHILFDILSHPSTGPNSQFSNPTDQAIRGADPLTGPGNSLHLRPLVPLDGKRAIVVDRSMAGPAMVEAVLSAVRGHEGGDAFQSNIIGPGVESLICGEFLQHGIAIHTGDYDTPKSHGECDIVIDEPGYLVFIESKAKPLARNAANGNDVDVLLSLAGSVVAAMEQSFGHEIQLRKNGKLDLKKTPTGSVTHTLTWNDQKVDRIALALFDYGAFQDNTAISKLIWPMLNARYGAIDPAVQAAFKNQFEKLNAKVLPKLNGHLELWNELGMQGEDPFFSGSWFLSVPQLFALLDGIQGPVQFLERLAFLRNLTYQSFNFHHQLKHALALKEQRDWHI